MEGTFLISLSGLMISADRKATQEFRELQAANLVSQVFQTATNLFFSVAYESKMADPTMPSQVNRWIAQSAVQVKQTRQAFALANHDTSQFDTVEKCLLAVGSVARRTFQDGLSLQQRESIAWGSSVEMEAASNELIAIWLEIRKHLESPTASASETSMAFSVLNLAVAGNMLALILMIYVVNRGLVSPLRRLALDCDNLKHSKLMPRPRNITNEIGSLEESFFHLSEIIQQNEQRKLSSAEMLKAAQTITLDKLSACFERVRNSFSEDSKARKKVQASLDSVDSLRELLESLERALRSRRTNELNLSSCKWNSLVETAVSSTESLCEQRKVTIERSGVTDGDLVADKQLIIRVLVNFLSNAIKFSPPGGTINIAVDSTQQEVVFRVTDKGPGISESDREKLFQPFKQAQSANDAVLKGTGLGLSSCKEIVRQHDGKIGCDSTYGEGSSFWFSLPKSSHLSVKSESDQSTTIAPHHAQIADKAPRHSIRLVFIVMLIGFVVPQIVLFFNLSAKFQEVARQTEQFKSKRSIFLRTEDLVYHLVYFRNAAWRASREQAFRAAGDIVPHYKILLDETKSLCKDTAKDEFVHSELKTVMKEEKQFFRDLMTMQDAVLKVYKDSPSLDPFLALSNRTVERLLGILRYESSIAETAYTLSNALHGQILSTVAAAGVFDTVALILLSVLALRMTNKISTLKRKAEDFAAGTELAVEIAGKDELAFLDRELVDASNVVSQAEADKRMLLAVINHDLRTPLASILATLETIKAGLYGELSPADVTLVASAERDAVKLLNRINNLLTLEKIEAGAFSMTPQQFSVRECITRVLAKYSRTEPQERAQFYFNGVADSIISGDQALFETMLAELVNNAVEAAPTDSKIALSIQSDSGFRIKIENPGAGIDEKLLPQIFERFRFIDGAPLIGLGLPLAQRIAKMHGAEISICSENNSSNTVVLEFANSAQHSAAS